ncbi:hypothetical protein BH09BAC1_BH09BAC1_17970 [soil metagenome]
MSPKFWFVPIILLAISCKEQKSNSIITKPSEELFERDSIKPILGSSLISEPIVPDSIIDGIAYFSEAGFLDFFLVNALELNTDFLILSPPVDYDIQHDSIRAYSIPIDTNLLVFREANTENEMEVLINGRLLNTQLLTLVDDWKANIAAIDYQVAQFYYYPKNGLIVVIGWPTFWTGRIMRFSICHVIDMSQLRSFAFVTYGGAAPIINNNNDALEVLTITGDYWSMEERWELDITSLRLGNSNCNNNPNLQIKSSNPQNGVRRVKVYKH